MTRRNTPRPLRDVLAAYLERSHVSGDGSQQYSICLNVYDTHLNRPATLSDLTFKAIRKFLGDLLDSGRAAKTLNNRRQALLMLWRFAARRDWIECPRDDVIREELPKFSEPTRLPVAWSLKQLQALRISCERAPSIPQFGPAKWDGRHWLALVLVIWDTAHRIAALLECPRAAIDERGYLRMPADLTKTNREQIHELAPDTLRAIAAMPESVNLFAWPHKKRQLWICYERDVLLPSGLPFDRHHKFQCLRRTSASHLCAAADEYAAMRHLGHSSVSVTRSGYLDPSIAYTTESAARILPRF